MSHNYSTSWLEREDHGDVTVLRVRLPRLLDDDDTRIAFQQMFALMDEMGRHRVILSLHNVRMVGSLALGKLVMTNRKVQVAGGRLALCELEPDVIDVMQVTHLDDILSIYDTEADALRAFQEGGTGPAAGG